MPEAKPSSRRRHGADLKARVLAACSEPGASVAQVAMAHGLNANLVHKWRRAKTPVLAARTAAFIELPLAKPATLPVAQDIRIELQRGPTTVSITWPAGCASECAAWLRDLLR